VIAVHAAQDGARYERQPSRLEMKKLLLAGIAALVLATGAAQQTAQAGYFGSDKWTTNCRHSIIEKRRPQDDEQPDWLMGISKNSSRQVGTNLTR
jgi:hypothetical protein